jgi:hypothetical protein
MRSSFIKTKSWFRVASLEGVGDINYQPNHRAGNSSTPAPQPSRPPVVASTPPRIPHPGRAVRPISSARIHDGVARVGAGILCSCVPSSLHNPTLQGWAGRGSELGAGHCSAFRGSAAGEVFHLVESRSSKARCREKRGRPIPSRPYVQRRQPHIWDGQTSWALLSILGRRCGSATHGHAADTA